jgi:hypothetical protein
VLGVTSAGLSGGGKNFVERTATYDETWAQCYTPERRKCYEIGGTTAFLKLWPPTATIRESFLTGPRSFIYKITSFMIICLTPKLRLYLNIRSVKPIFSLGLLKFL